MHRIPAFRGAHLARAGLAGLALTAGDRHRGRTALADSTSEYYDYVVVGSATAAHAALEAIRVSAPATHTILMITDADCAFERLDLGDAGKSPSSSSESTSASSRALFTVYNEWRRHVSPTRESYRNFQGEDLEVTRGTSEMRIDVEKKIIHLTGEDSGSSSSSSSTSQQQQSTIMMQSMTTPTSIEEALDALATVSAQRINSEKDHKRIRFGKCVVATAGHPRAFYVLESDKISYTLSDHINTLNDWSDFKTLARLADDENGRKSVTVVGGGFLGTEVAYALAQSPSCDVHQVFVEDKILSQYIPAYLSDHVTRKLVQDFGVEMHDQCLVTGVRRSGEMSNNDDDLVASQDENEDLNEPKAIRLTLSVMPSGAIETDHVVLASTNIDPNLECVSRDRMLEIDQDNGGIVVNSSLEAYSGVFVAGNAASYYDRNLGRRRADTFDHAVNSGLCAGRNMVAKSGRVEAYEHIPSFSAHLPGLEIVGLGDISSALETVGVWLQHDTSEFSRGIVYYLKDSRVVGVLLCNAGECVEQARDVLHEQAVLARPQAELKQRIPIAPSHWLSVLETP